MNAEVRAVTAEERKVEHSQYIRAAHATPIEILQTCKQYVARAEVCAQNQQRRAKKLRRKGRKTGTCDDMPCRGKFMTSELAYELSKLQGDVKHWANVGRVAKQNILDVDKVLSDKEEEIYTISQQKMPDNDNIPSDDEESDDQIAPQQTPDKDSFDK